MYVDVRVTLFTDVHNVPPQHWGQNKEEAYLRVCIGRKEMYIYAFPNSR